jgi:beta-galactosidase
LTLPVHITKPHLWDAGNDPYLYRAVVEVLDGTKVLDRVDQLLGLRYFSVDPAKGFSLNGKSYPLHGVSRHQDRLDKGWAISDADTEQDVSLIREVGATCLRTAHYQQSDDLYSLCDRAGIVVWTELCMVNNVGRTEEFKDNAKQQLEELIRQNYNHPSICFWSLWNEIAFVGGKGPNQDDLAFLTSLNETAKSLDPTRLTVAANNAMSVQRYAAPITDLIGWNLYPGWYGGKPGEFGGTLSDIEKNIPGHAVAFSEYGAGGSIYQHGAETTPPSPGGLYHPEEWQAKIHEADWKFLSSRSDLWATFVWNMFDFASLGRNEGDHPGRNDKGLVTYDRAVRKDAFYFYQAQWSKTLMARITSERYNPRPTGPAEVKVYSNGDQVDLNVNGRSAGIKSGEAGVFKWNVTLPAGEVRVEAIATRGTRKASDVAVWTCSPTAPPRIGPPDPPKQTGAG